MLRRTAALITLLFSLLSITSMASAEEYANATEARAAAVKAMKDFQSASLECKDITNAKNNLTALERAGIKLILERSKTLLDDCAVPDMFSEKSIKELNTDTGNTPAKSISDYSDYVMEFEAYSSSIESVVDDINEMLPNLKELGSMVSTRNNELTFFESSISKFDGVYMSYSTDVKNKVSASSAWSSYQNLKSLLATEKDNYGKVLLLLDDLNRLVDIEGALDEVKVIFTNKIPNAELEKNINEMVFLATPKSTSDVKSSKPSSTKSSTITCIKGKSSKKITAVNPKCPAGFKKK